MPHCIAMTLPRRPAALRMVGQGGRDELAWHRAGTVTTNVRQVDRVRTEQFSGCATRPRYMGTALVTITLSEDPHE